MSDLPPGWEWASLDQIAEVRLGRQRSPKNHAGADMRPYLRAANVGWDGLRLEDVKSMNFTDSELDTYRLLPGDIVLAEASGSASEVGKPAIWRGEIEDCCLQNTLIRVRSLGVDPTYLMYFLRAEALRGAFAERSRGVGIYHIGSSRLSRWKIPIPPFNEQQRIAESLESNLSRLDSGSDVIASIVRRGQLSLSAKLEEIIDRYGTAELPLARYIVGAQYGTSLKCSYDGRGPAVLRIPNIQGGRIETTDLKFAENDATSMPGSLMIRRGDLLVVRTNGAKNLIGRSAVAHQDMDYAFASYLIRLRFDTTLLPEWVQLCMQSPRIRRTIEDLAASSAGQYNLSIAKLKSLPIPAPQISDQRQCVEEYSTFSDSVSRLVSDVLNLEPKVAQLRRSLFAEAFAGNLVHQDVHDEPASLLLERIRYRSQLKYRQPGRVSK